MQNMKKTILFLALAIVAGVSCSTADAKDKKDKKNKQEAVVEKVAEKAIINLQSKSDSVNYAAGQTFTQGMMEYVIGQLKVDTTYMEYFKQGLHEALSKAADETPQGKAKAAGEQIAQMVRDRMMPGLKEQLNGTDITYNEEYFKRGFEDAVAKDASIFAVSDAASYFEGQLKDAQAKKAEAAKAEGKQWLAENSKKEGVVTLPSGLQYKVLVKGDGPVADKDQDVVVKYEGKLIDGTIFDSSYQRNPQTTSFKPTQVIKGWTEALCMMPQGSTWELYIPEDLAYGERAQGQIPAYSTLIFKVEVVEVKAKAADTTAAKAEPAKTAAKPAVKATAKPVAKKR